MDTYRKDEPIGTQDQPTTFDVATIQVQQSAAAGVVYLLCSP